MKHNLQLIREELVLVSNARDKSLQSLPQVTWHLGIYCVLDFTLSPLKENVSQQNEIFVNIFAATEMYFLGDKLACIVLFYIGIIKPW